MTSRTSRSRRPLLVAFLSILLAGLAASAARAADPPPEPITTGTVEWGVKESFRNYIVGGIARGEVVLDGGVSRTAAGAFSFPVTGGVFDPGVDGTVASTAGGVRFSGHRGELDMHISEVRVELLPEGALLRADVRSLPRGSTVPVDYPDVAFAELDLSAVDPVTLDGVTTWTAIPAELTPAGAPAFSGFYQAGTELDPVTLSYEGNGGKPQPEGFTPAGTPFYARLEVATPGVQHVISDPQRRLVHKVGNDAVNAVDEDTLETVGTPHALVFDVDRQVAATAFDPVEGRVFVAWGNGTVSVFTWNGGGYTRDELPGTPGTSKLAVADGKLYLASDAPTGNPVVTVVSGEPGAWTVTTHPAIDTGGVEITQLAGLPDGRLVATLRASIVAPPFPAVVTPREPLLMTDTGSEFTVSPIAGATPPAAPGRMTFGYVRIEPGPDGSLLLAELGMSLAQMNVQWLRVTGSGVAVDGPPVGVTPTTTYAVDPRSGRIGLAHLDDDQVSGRIEVVERDGTPFTTIAGVRTTRLAATDDTFYAMSDNDPRPTVRMRLTGVSPAVTGDPVDAVVELPDAGTTGTATFTAAADATPAATVQWQLRPLGVTRWSDVAGATATTLTVDAPLAANGTRYRAVFENGGGRIGTRPATLTVTVAAPRPPVDEPRTPAEQPRTPGEQPRTPAPQPRAPARDAAVKPLPRSTVAVPRGTRRASRGGVVRVATISCPRGAACRVAAPRQVRVRIGGRTFTARVLTPARVAAGRRAAIRAKLPRAAVRRLAGRAATVTVNVTVRADGWKALTRTAEVRVRSFPSRSAGTRG